MENDARSLDSHRRTVYDGGAVVVFLEDFVGQAIVDAGERASELLSDPRPMAQPLSSSESAMVIQQFESLSNLTVSFKG